MGQNGMNCSVQFHIGQGKRDETGQFRQMTDEQEEEELSDV